MQRVQRAFVSSRFTMVFLGTVILSYVAFSTVNVSYPQFLGSTSSNAPILEQNPSTSSPVTSKYRQVTDYAAFEAPKGVPAGSSYMDYFSLDDHLQANEDEDQDELIRRMLHFSNYLYKGYDAFTRALGLEELAKKASLTQKCKVFFELLTRDDPDWEVREILDHNMRVVEKKQIIADLTQTAKEEWHARYAKFPESQEGIYNIEKKYEDMLQKTLQSAQNSADDITITRVYGKCFFNDEPDRDMETYRKYSPKVFPYLSETLPKFCRGNSSPCLQGVFPVYNDKNVHAGESVAFDSKTDNYMEFVRTKITGKGIVISATTKHEKLLTGLIRLLRANENKLPIQIVHRGDLDPEAQKRLNVVATESTAAMFDRHYSSEELQVLPHIDILKEATESEISFPEQDLWFVDVTPCFSDRYRSKFSEFRNKLLAYFLNSFSEIILIDADTIPLISTTDYFKTPQYLETGTHLFVDRSLTSETNYMQLNTVSRLMPINDRSIDSLFDIPLVTNKTLGNDYMLGWYHFAESGLVAMDRKRHFTSMLIAVYLAFSNQFVGGLLYGDKEFFWMSLAMAGGEDYAFNGHRAGAVGKSFEHTPHPFGPESGSRTLVSSHPGHIGDDGRLLWINSGFAYCKNKGYDAHLNIQYYKEYSAPELQALFSNPVKLEAIMIPPSAPALFKPRLPYSKTEMKRMEETRDFFKNIRNKDHLLEDETPLKASHEGWTLFNGCGNYDYAAFEKIASFDENKVYDYGTYLEFRKDVVDKYDFLGKVWLNMGQPKTL